MLDVLVREASAMSELSFAEALDALDASYRLGGVAAAVAVFESQPVFLRAADKQAVAPVLTPWTPALRRAAVVDVVQAAIHEWTRIVAHMAPADHPAFMAAGAKRLHEQFGPLVAMVGLKLVGMNLVLDPHAR
jgi:hypothetical protein